MFAPPYSGPLHAVPRLLFRSPPQLGESLGAFVARLLLVALWLLSGCVKRWARHEWVGLLWLSSALVLRVDAVSLWPALWLRRSRLDLILLPPWGVVRLTAVNAVTL